MLTFHPTVGSTSKRTVTLLKEIPVGTLFTDSTDDEIRYRTVGGWVNLSRCTAVQATDNHKFYHYVELVGELHYSRK
jgi:hypothetical protein